MAFEETGIQLDTIYNEDCLVTMNRGKHFCDIILTSPFYNISDRRNTRTVESHASKNLRVRYDDFQDNMMEDEYFDFSIKLFNAYDKILKPNGCVLYNLSYNDANVDCMFKTINEIITHTPFSVADVLVWKKNMAIPNVSPNKMARICEFIFVFCRKDEIKTFHSNKKFVRVSEQGHKIYSNNFNFILAPNNDGVCPYNKATFSTALCRQLIDLYCPEGGVVYDSFMGSGTTAVACLQTHRRYVGSEISKKQCEWAEDRLNKYRKEKRAKTLF